MQNCNGRFGIEVVERTAWTAPPIHKSPAPACRRSTQRWVLVRHPLCPRDISWGPGRMARNMHPGSVNVCSYSVVTTVIGTSNPQWSTINGPTTTATNSGFQVLQCRSSGRSDALGRLPDRQGGTQLEANSWASKASGVDGSQLMLIPAITGSWSPKMPKNPEVLNAPATRLAQTCCTLSRGMT